MTYPRTAEEKARQLGTRFACEAFNACGSLDAKKCQEMGDALGLAIAELVRSARPERRPLSPFVAPTRCVEDGCENHLSGPGLRYCWEHGFAERAARPVPFEIPQDLDTLVGVSEPAGTSWSKP